MISPPVGALLPGELRRDTETLVAFVHHACTACDVARAGLSERRASIEAAGAGIWVVHTHGEAALVVADRYGKVYAVLRVHGARAEALIEDAAQWIDFVQMQCPECGVPEW